MNKEVISTIYMLAWLVNSTVWAAAAYISNKPLAPVFSAVWMAVSIMVWWIDLRPTKRQKNAVERPPAG